MRKILPLTFVLVACQSTPTERRDLADVAIAVFRTVGDAMLRVDGLAALKKYAPEAVAIIDTNQDLVITLAEIEGAAAMVMSNPEMAVGLLAAAYMMRKHQD
jgi:hypothetical protein